MEGLCAVCGGLGAFKPDDDGNERYVKGDDCLENLKDLQRYMRRDNPETRDVFFELGKWNIVRYDLVPLVLAYRADDEVVINVVKVMVFLTMPMDPTSSNLPLQFEYLRGFKDAFLEQDAIGVIVTHLERPLEHLESGSTTEDDWKLVQLMLTLFRNLLCICDPPQQKIAASTPHLQFLKDELLERLFRENVMDVLLALTQHMGGCRGFLRHDNLLMVEIFHYIFWGQQPGSLASVEKAQKQAGSSSSLLRALREKEKDQRRRQNAMKRCRPPRFEGTYSQVCQDGSKGVVSSNPFQSPFESMMKRSQIRRGPVKRVALDEQHSITGNADLLARLKDLADQFLASGYNILMQAVKEDIQRERVGVQASDILNFFRVAEFFTSYLYDKGIIFQKQIKCEVTSDNRIHEIDKQCGPIAATMDEEMFSLVISKWNEYAESGKQIVWKSVNIAGALIKSMIRILDNILKTASPNTKEGQQEIRVARILLYKVFYDQTENGILNFLLQLLKSFDIHKQPRRHLTDLVETTHIVLRLLESLSKEDGALRVITKARNVSKRTKKQGESDDQADEASQRLKDQDLERAEDLQEGVNMQNHSTDQAVDEATDIVMEEITKDTGDEGEVQSVKNVDPAEPVDEEKPKVKEVSLDIKKFAGRFADNTVLRNYCWLLKNYRDNCPATNYYILRMLERICNDHALEPLLYQISLLRIFRDILSDGKVQTAEEHRALYEFLTRIVRNMFKKLRSQPIMFVDLLFWKTRGECHNITANYMLHKFAQDKSSKRNREFYDGLGDDEAEIVHVANDGHSGKNRREAIDDALGEDEDNEGMAENAREAKRSLADALGDDGDMEAGFATEAAETLLEDLPAEKQKLKRLHRKGRGSPLNLQQDELIKELFQQFKEKRNCLKLIAEAVDSEGSISPAQVGRKLKQLGLRRASKFGEAGNDIEDDNAQAQRNRNPNGDGEVMQKQGRPAGDGAVTRKRPRRLLNERSLTAIRQVEAGTDDVPLLDTITARSSPIDIDSDNYDDTSDNVPLSRRLRMKPIGSAAELDHRSVDDCGGTSTQQGSGLDRDQSSLSENLPASITDTLTTGHQRLSGACQSNNFRADELTEMCPSLRPLGVLLRKRRPNVTSIIIETSARGSPPPEGSSLEKEGVDGLERTACAAVGPTELPKRRRLAKRVHGETANSISEVTNDDKTLVVQGFGLEGRQPRRSVILSDSEGD